MRPFSRCWAQSNAPPPMPTSDSRQFPCTTTNARSSDWAIRPSNCVQAGVTTSRREFTFDKHRTLNGQPFHTIVIRRFENRTLRCAYHGFDKSRFHIVSSTTRTATTTTATQRRRRQLSTGEQRKKKKFCCADGCCCCDSLFLNRRKKKWIFFSSDRKWCNSIGGKSLFKGILVSKIFGKLFSSSCRKCKYSSKRNSFSVFFPLRKCLGLHLSTMSATTTTMFIYSRQQCIRVRWCLCVVCGMLGSQCYWQRAVCLGVSVCVYVNENRRRFMMCMRVCMCVREAQRTISQPYMDVGILFQRQQSTFLWNFWRIFASKRPTNGQQCTIILSRDQPASHIWEKSARYRRREAPHLLTRCTSHTRLMQLIVLLPVALWTKPFWNEPPCIAISPSEGSPIVGRSSHAWMRCW